MRDFLYDVLEWFADSFIGSFIIMGLGVVLALSVICAALNPIFAHTCRATAAVLEVEVNYGFWTGCNFKIGDVWIPDDQYAAVVLP